MHGGWTVGRGEPAYGSLGQTCLLKQHHVILTVKIGEGGHCMLVRVLGALLVVALGQGCLCDPAQRIRPPDRYSIRISTPQAELLAGVSGEAIVSSFDWQPCLLT
jgi:hypothetical protein